MSHPDDKTAFLFDIGPPSADPGKLVGRPRHPVWTQNKARFIARYMQLFVMVTKSGTYIDGFAGPQYPDKLDLWSAALVLANRPKLLRHFYFFETDPQKMPLIDALIAAQERPYGRTIDARYVDSNIGIRELLASGVIKDKEPTFALLDQHTNECDWDTVKALAYHKTSGHKIELLYFLANGWLGRTLAATKDEESLERWWGSSDWKLLRDMRPEERGQTLARRFERELGYACAMAYPIYDDGTNIMYFLVHATDHPGAPALMMRAYKNVHESDRAWSEEQGSLLARSSMLLSDADGHYRANCARCAVESDAITGEVSGVVEQLTALGWTSVHDRKWICPDCEGKPLPPAPRASKKQGKKAQTK